jgi:hypothetical protein
MRTLVFAAAIALCMPAAAMAQEEKSPGEHLDQMVQDVLDAVGMVIRMVPQYEMPEVLPNGDIIIRRVQPEEPPPDEEKQGPDSEPEDGVKT